MGIVYESEQQSLERPIAVKILTRKHDELQFPERFHREAKASAD